MYIYICIYIYIYTHTHTHTHMHSNLETKLGKPGFSFLSFSEKIIGEATIVFQNLLTKMVNIKKKRWKTSNTFSEWNVTEEIGETWNGKGAWRPSGSGMKWEANNICSTHTGFMAGFWWRKLDGQPSVSWFKNRCNAMDVSHGVDFRQFGKSSQTLVWEMIQQWCRWLQSKKSLKEYQIHSYWWMYLKGSNTFEAKYL